MSVGEPDRDRARARVAEKVERLWARNLGLNIQQAYAAEEGRELMARFKGLGANTFTLGTMTRLYPSPEMPYPKSALLS